MRLAHARAFADEATEGTAMREEPTILIPARVATRPNPSLRAGTAAAGTLATSTAGATRHTRLALWVIGLLLAVTACNSPDSQQPDVSLSTRTTSATVPTSSTSPSTPASGGSTTSAGGGVEVPEVETIVMEMAPPGDAVVLGTIEYFEWVAECARRAGESVSVSDSPPTLSTKRNSRTIAVLDACHAAAEEQPWFVPYPFDGSEEANRLEYRLYLEVHECLLVHGYPTVEPPSEETYVAEGSSVWHPFDAMPFRQLSVGDEAPPPGSSDQLEAQRRCAGDLATLYQEHVIDTDGDATG